MDNNEQQPAKDPMPIDPSHTSGINDNAEQGIVATKHGISEQSAQWEDEAENLFKHPSPEEKGTTNGEE